MTAVWERDDVGGIQLAPADPAAPSPGELLGEAQIFLDALASARRLVRRGVPFILLQGESGMGRTLFARSIHYEGPAPQEPLIAVQCASVPPSLLEAELFGAPAGSLPGQAERKAGILELAGEGTVFLDGVQDLPGAVRRRLASCFRRMNTESPLRCWLLGASRVKPEIAPKDDRLVAEFQDILYRNMIELPPLRSRERDVELLARHFLRSWAIKRASPCQCSRQEPSKPCTAIHGPVTSESSGTC